MKRITTILTFLMLLCMGSWADVTVTLVDGTGTNAPFDYYGTCSTSTTPHTFTTKATSGLAGLVLSAPVIDRATWWSTYCLALMPSATQTNENITLTAPDGYFITAISMTVQANSSNFPYDVTVGGETTRVTGASSVPFSVSNLLVNSYTITFNHVKPSFDEKGNKWLAVRSMTVTLMSEYEYASASITSGNKYAIYTLNNGTTEGSTPYFLTGTGYLTDNILNAQTFTFTATTQDVFVPAGNAWFVNNGSKPFTNPEQSTRDNHIHVSGQGTRQGWDAQVFYKNSEGKYAVRATNAGANDTWHSHAFWTVDADETSDGIPEADYAVTLNERHYVWNIMSESDFNFLFAKAKANQVLDELAQISVYSTTAAAAKTALASAATIEDIETTVNNAVNINVAFGNINTTAPVMYLATTGADILGSTFSTDAAWKLTEYDALSGSFKVYNEAHETYLAPLPSAMQTAATATTNAASAGQWVIQATDNEDADGAGHLVFVSTLSFDSYSSYKALHYQTDGSKAVRWDASSKASKWDVTNVYGLTYNHYKVADAETPATDGATLFASSTNYYLSGTEIEYTEPIESLSPVDALNDQPEDGSISSDVVVNYYYEQDATLPFTTSTITNGELDNPTWYYMTINDFPAYASGNKLVVESTGNGLHHERWCFVGDAVNGVQIINEEKGVAYPVNIASMANNDNVQITSTSTNTRWFVTGSTLDDLTFYQKSGETTYALSQLGGVTYGSDWSWRIGLWSSGSTIVLTESTNAAAKTRIDEALVTISADDAFVNAGKLGYPSVAVGGPYRTFFSSIPITDILKTPAAYRQLIANWNTYLSTTDLVMPEVGKFYRIKGKVSGKYVSGTPSSYSEFLSMTTATDRTTIYYIGEGTKLLSYDTGQFMKSTTLRANVGEAGDSYTITGKEIGYFNVKDGGSFLYDNGNTAGRQCVDRQGSDGGNNTKWSFEEVTELPITVNQVGDKYYATLYMPVPVSISNSTAYTLQLTADNKWLTPTEVDGNVPAEQPVLLVGTSSSVTATVESTAGDNVDTPLEGTLAAIAVDAETDYFLGRYRETEDDPYEVGFFKWTGTTLKGFRAYLPATEVAASRGFAIKWNDDEVTGIRSIDNGKQSVKNGAFYDLSGRRVENPQHGLYIVNGKKVVIK